MKEELRKGKSVEERDTKMEDSQPIREEGHFSFTDKPDKGPAKGSVVIITDPQGVASFIPKDSHPKDPSSPLGTLSSKKEKLEEPTSPIVTLVTKYGTLPLPITPQSPAKGSEPLVVPPPLERRVSCGQDSYLGHPSSPTIRVKIRRQPPTRVAQLPIDTLGTSSGPLALPLQTLFGWTGG